MSVRVLLTDQSRRSLILSWIFKLISAATTTATDIDTATNIDTASATVTDIDTATDSAANKTWIFKRKTAVVSRKH